MSTHDHTPSHHTPSHPATPGLSSATARREAFWHNVVRDTLNSLAATAASFSGRLSADASGAATAPLPDHDLFDGRMAVITKLGQRIPIADIYPVFACSVPSSRSPDERAIAADVQCSIFQIRTPSGEVYTLPIHEIVSVHALSESLVKQMEAAALAQADSAEPDAAPFGFAAFTSLARSEREAARRSETDDSIL